ncbi:MAG TPA: FtsW/RodA/SpoVE family cell cycle protein, partial [Firmicutes bacterium]|nr:FtsW/RodA/SpoVE family cell cycle protein [Bacillota bacterium]
MASSKPAALPAASQKPKKRFRLFSVSQGFDMPFLIILMIILVVGLICQFSAGYAYSYYWNDGDSFYFIKRQLIFALIGVAAMLFISTIDYHILHHFAIPLMLVSLAMLVVVLFLPASDGIHRWIR